MKNKVSFSTSLSLKILLMLVISIGVFVSIFGFYGMRETKHILMDQSQNYAQSIAKGLAKAISGSFTKDFSGDTAMDLHNAIYIMGTSYENVESIKVYIADKLVAKYSAIDPRLGANPDEIISVKGDEYEVPIMFQANDATLHLGKVAIIYKKMAYYDMYLKQMKRMVFSSIILLFSGSTILFLIISWLVLTPVKEIEKGALKIGNGDLDHKIELDRRDELGQLAYSFNEMAASLKKSRREIEEWNRTLEKKVADRTVELEEANTKLQKAQYELVQASKLSAIGMIGAGVAHELNNPLAGIIGYVQMLTAKFRKKVMDEKEVETCGTYLGHVGREANRCKGIVDSLLNFSRKTKSVYEEVLMQECIDATLSIMKFQMRKWNMNVKREDLEHDRSPVKVSGNADKLQQVFINLIANAHHAMPDGGDIVFDVSQETKNGKEYGVASVRDTGCGIPKENIDKLFKAFFSTEKDSQNLGLGLSISNQILKDHGGFFHVESVVGEGTEFKVFVPAK